MRRAAIVAVLTLTLVPTGSVGDDGPDPGAPDRSGPPRRIVSLLPAATEIIVGLGGTALLAARTDGDTARALAHLPSVGPLLTPDLEVLASVAPDLVILWAGAHDAGVRRLVERRAGTVEAMAIERLDEIVPAIGRIGGWVGRTEEARRLAESFASGLRRARAIGETGGRPRLLWVVSAEPLVLAGPGTFIDDVIDVAGGENAARSAGTPWPRLGRESLLALDPDVLVWPGGPGLFPAAELHTRSGWRTLRAVQARRVLEVDAERFHDPGPEIGHAAVELALLLVRTAPR